MGALAEDTCWVAQDDCLLKNALEAGASLESLSKGAVHFSQRFTAQELQDRWNCLLYDPLVSAEASARMTEIEQNHSEDIKSFSEKRKFDSVRQQYYAMRKKICNEPLDSIDPSSFDGPGTGCIRTEALQTYTGLDSNFGILNPKLPNTGMGAAIGLDATDIAFCTGGDVSTCQNNMDNIITQTLEENIALVGHCSVVEEFGKFEEVCNLLEADDGGSELPPFTDQTHRIDASGYSGFRECQALNSMVPDCGGTFHHLEHSSPIPEMPVWSAIEGLPCPILPHIQAGQDEQAGRTFVFPSDGVVRATTELGYDVVQSDAMVGNHNSASGTEDYLAELSNSLFDFSNEEELLLMNSDGSNIDKSYIEGLSSLLLDSPNHEGRVNIDATEASAPSDEFQNNSNVEEPSDNGESPLRPSALNPELHNGAIYCRLNTEDPDIPCNDDVFLLTCPSLSKSTLPFEMQWKTIKPSFRPISSFNIDTSVRQKVDASVPNQIMRERNSFDQSLITFPMTGSQFQPELDLITQRDSGCDLDIPKSQLVAWNASTPRKGPTKLSSVDLHGCSSFIEPLNKVVIQTEQTDYTSHISADFKLGKQAGESDSLISFPFKNENSHNHDVQNSAATVQSEEILHGQVGPTEMTIPDLVVRQSSTDGDEDEFPTWIDDDLPCYSDIEAMILDMDLSPDDQDIYSRRTVSKYEPEGTKRTIIRLEQAADACMRRNMTSQGAFAVLYDHYSKYYIKKPQVLLGRATEDMIVDIDLGREGQNTKISRRQAIIEMDKDGLFLLKNLGRYPIFVNSTEVASEQSLGLNSGCLIEVRGISFVFETNETFIRKYLDTIKNES